MAASIRLPPIPELAEPPRWWVSPFEAGKTAGRERSVDEIAVECFEASEEIKAIPGLVSELRGIRCDEGIVDPQLIFLVDRMSEISCTQQRLAEKTVAHEIEHLVRSQLLPQISSYYLPMAEALGIKDSKITRNCRDKAGCKVLLEKVESFLAVLRKCNVDITEPNCVNFLVLRQKLAEVVTKAEPQPDSLTLPRRGEIGRRRIF